MRNSVFETPVLFLIFNRPDLTKIVFQTIREIKPRYLFIGADGPRKNIPGEVEICNETRETVLKSIDWDCDIKTLFRENNLGCGIAVSSAITWFFDHVEEGIILEDDCLPNLSFYTYCSQLLSYYRNNESIMMISGNNFQCGIKRGKGDYYFSAYNHIWGWATWRRAWRNYDFELSIINSENIDRILRRYFLTQTQRDFWRSNYFSVKYDKIDTWDYQWSFSIFAADGLTILPNVNLVSNIGFGENATHTILENDMLSKINTSIISLPLRHTRKIWLNKEADKYFFHNVLCPPQKKKRTKQIQHIVRLFKKNKLLSILNTWLHKKKITTYHFSTKN